VSVPLGDAKDAVRAYEQLRRGEIDAREFCSTMSVAHVFYCLEKDQG
jgi:hypothetical protein